MYADEKSMITCSHQRLFFIYNSNKSSLNIPDLLRSLCYIKYVTQNM